MKLNENISRIKFLMETISSVDVIEQNVSDPRLIKILKNIENVTNQKFEQSHFDKEKSISGDLKIENGGLDSQALKAFQRLQSVCDKLFYDEDSYRTYERQAELFIEYVKKYGSIDGAMRLRAIPGFSQHHTGKAFDVKPIEARACVAQNANNFGFEFPYLGDGIRQKEPWHIYFSAK